MSNFPYDKTTEMVMKRLYNNLLEKDRRHYASVEAIKLGHSGIGYISKLFGIDPKTIRSGLDELKKMSFVDQAATGGKEGVVKQSAQKKAHSSSGNSNK